MGVLTLRGARTSDLLAPVLSLALHTREIKSLASAKSGEIRNAPSVEVRDPRLHSDGTQHNLAQFFRELGSDSEELVASHSPQTAVETFEGQGEGKRSLLPRRQPPSALHLRVARFYLPVPGYRRRPSAFAGLDLAVDPLELSAERIGRY